MRKTIKVELTEQDLKDILSKEFGFEENGSTLRISRVEGGRSFESSHTTIVIEGVPKK